VNLPQIVVIGGGFSGAAFTVQCARAVPSPARLTVVEPNPEPGRGVAFSSDNAQLRLNAPHLVHLVDPARIDDFPKWVANNDVLQDDPEAVSLDGTVYVHRASFGAFVNAQFQDTLAKNPSDSEVRHTVARAVDIDELGSGLRIFLDSGEALDAEVVIVATGNDAPLPPPQFNEDVTTHPGYVGEPLRRNALVDVDPAGRVLVVGSALTAADVMVSLLRNGHTGPIDSISRTGLLPARKAPSLSVDANVAWQRITTRNTLFVERHGELDTVGQIVKALRADIALARRNGLPWQGPFDELRDSLRAVWPRLGSAEKGRYLRHLRRWYDSHRFRLPPQLESVLDAAADHGQIRYLVGRLNDARVDGDTLRVRLRERASEQLTTRSYAAVINCTGPSGRPGRSESPFTKALLSKGLARSHATGIGFDVDEACTAIRRNGRRCQGLRFLGSTTLGAFGEPLASPWIAAQIHGLLPGLLSQLGMKPGRNQGDQSG
jgi:uncharacterized NAD(P)/FAD-binding protein YdhS